MELFLYNAEDVSEHTGSLDWICVVEVQRLREEVHVQYINFRLVLIVFLFLTIPSGVWAQPILQSRSSSCHLFWINDPFPYFVLCHIVQHAAENNIRPWPQKKSPKYATKYLVFKHCHLLACWQCCCHSDSVSQQVIGWAGRQQEKFSNLLQKNVSFKKDWLSEDWHISYIFNQNSKSSCHHLGFSRTKHLSISL